MGEHADIRDPEELKRVRRSLAVFLEECMGALDGATGAVPRISAWLEQMQIPQWKREGRKLHDRMDEARAAYVYAKGAGAAMGKVGWDEEYKAFKKAEAAYQDVAVKLEACRKWAAQLERVTKDSLALVLRSRSRLTQDGPGSLGSLDRMIDGVEEYLG